MTAKAGTGHQGRLWNFQHGAEEGTSKHLWGWLWYADLAFGFGRIDHLLRSLSACYLISYRFSYAKSETMQFAFRLWQQMGSFLQSQWVLNCSFKQHPFLSFLALLLLRSVPASTFLTWGPAKLWFIPYCINPKKSCCIFHPFFSFIQEASIKLKFLRYGTKKEIFKALNFASNWISEAVRIEKLSYTKGLPSPVSSSLLLPKLVTWRK